jgi:hypothetical protein
MKTNNKQYTEKEIETVLETQFFKHTYVPEFKFPEVVSIKSPYSWYKSYINIAAPLLALPAFIFVFAFIFNQNSNNNLANSKNKDLAMLEASNNRLLAEIQTLDDESLNK